MNDPFTRSRGPHARCRRSDGRSPARACPPDPDRDRDLDPDPNLDPGPDRDLDPELDRDLDRDTDRDLDRDPDRGPLRRLPAPASALASATPRPPVPTSSR